MDTLTRRGFLSAAVTGTAGALAARAHASSGRARGEPSAAPSGFRGTLCLFSKLLPDLPAGELGRAVAALGFGGVDLTVRPGGHVVPERAALDLPPFLAAVRENGLEVPMITTGLLSAADPTAR
ncbi:MAG TPA: sugar phosphate isomerase/epimerase, partial [Vicinamibacteria bacterium]|nr:sugar phosphate isomerase/epimerase [Vicinamibacteria bacterium]